MSGAGSEYAHFALLDSNVHTGERLHTEANSLFTRAEEQDDNLSIGYLDEHDQLDFKTDGDLANTNDDLEDENLEDNDHLNSDLEGHLAADESALEEHGHHVNTNGQADEDYLDVTHDEHFLPTSNEDVRLGIYLEGDEDHLDTEDEDGGSDLTSELDEGGENNLDPETDDDELAASLDNDDGSVDEEGPLVENLGVGHYGQHQWEGYNEKDKDDDSDEDLEDGENDSDYDDAGSGDDESLDSQLENEHCLDGYFGGDHQVGFEFDHDQEEDDSDEEGGDFDEEEDGSDEGNEGHTEQAYYHHQSGAFDYYQDDDDDDDDSSGDTDTQGDKDDQEFYHDAYGDVRYYPIHGFGQESMTLEQLQEWRHWWRTFHQQNRFPPEIPQQRGYYPADPALEEEGEDEGEDMEDDEQVYMPPQQENHQPQEYYQPQEEYYQPQEEYSQPDYDQGEYYQGGYEEARYDDGEYDEGEYNGYGGY